MFLTLIVALICQITAIFFLWTPLAESFLTLYLACGILIYGIYVIVDLKMLTERIEIDDYILGALTLYIDLMTLFIYILQALGDRK